MDVIDEIFEEYRRMRQHGLAANEALRALRSHVEPLENAHREELARRLRAWEQGGEEELKATDETIAVRPKQLSKLAAPKPEEEIWVECEHCGRKNRKGEIFCFACGQLLNPNLGGSTRQFQTASRGLYSSEYFGSDSVVILHIHGVPKKEFELRPQLRQNEIVLGRSTKNVAVRPEIDLAEVGGAEQGVSRLHAALTYNSASELIYIHDLGSANGTFINEQRLHPSERRVLRNGDELRLGRMVITAQYRHPGEEIPG